MIERRTVDRIVENISKRACYKGNLSKSLIAGLDTLSLIILFGDGLAFDEVFPYLTEEEVDEGHFLLFKAYKGQTTTKENDRIFEIFFEDKEE